MTQYECLNCKCKFIGYKNRKCCSIQCAISYRIHNKKFKKCNSCNQITARFNDICAKCRDISRNKKRYEEKMILVNNLKTEFIIKCGNKCSICNILYEEPAMCFHHIDESNKSFTLDKSTIMKKLYEPQILYNELLKCQLVCANCHSILHEIQRTSNRKCRDKYQRGRKRKKQLIIDFGGSCNLCNFTSEYIQCMTFHHIYDKKFDLNVVNLTQYNMEKILEEAKKCKLLCFNCHLILHHSKKLVPSATR